MQLQLKGGQWIIISPNAKPDPQADAVAKIDLDGLTALSLKAHDNASGVTRFGPIQITSQAPFKNYRVTYERRQSVGDMKLTPRSGSVILVARTEDGARRTGAAKIERKLDDGFMVRTSDVVVECLDSL